jgi:hypothetical protein
MKYEDQDKDIYETYYSYFTITVVDNLLQVPKSILTFIEKLQVKLLRRLEVSIVCICSEQSKAISRAQHWLDRN